MDSSSLNTGHEIPRLGFGVYEIPPEDTGDCVLTALDAGYRHIDTAALYGNEAGVGEALRDSSVPRENIFVTTKLWNSEQGYEETLEAFEASMDKLGLDYLDLYLIHWPTPENDRYIEAWEAFEKLHDEGRIRSIGVSNFEPEHLKRLIEATEVIPAVNQIEIHPYLNQAGLRKFNASHAIVTEAWSPLAQGTLTDDRVLDEIAADHDRSIPEVALRWNLDIGNVVLSRSVDPDHIRSNFSVLDWRLSEEEVVRINQLDRDGRVGPDPDEFHGT